VFHYLIFLYFIANVSELKTCYKAYFFFFPIAQICIGYKKDGENFVISSLAKTLSFGNIVKKVYNFGWSIIDLKELKPKKFFYHQDEIGFRRDQYYIFKGDKIYVKKVIYSRKGNKGNTEEFGEFLNDDFVDPHTASLILYKEATRNENGILKIFYEDRYYYISYNSVGEEIVDSRLGNFRSKIVEVGADVETRGPIKPKEKWLVWLDKENLFPVKMQLNFTLGNLKVEIEKIEGDANLLKKVLQNSD
jgi:hypothetical protein